jgi:hypothetical protein
VGKLTSLAEGPRIASAKLWGAKAAAHHRPLGRAYRAGMEVWVYPVSHAR